MVWLRLARVVRPVNMCGRAMGATSQYPVVECRLTAASIGPIRGFEKLNGESYVLQDQVQALQENIRQQGSGTRLIKQQASAQQQHLQTELSEAQNNVGNLQDELLETKQRFQACRQVGLF